MPAGRARRCAASRGQCGAVGCRCGRRTVLSVALLCGGCRVSQRDCCRCGRRGCRRSILSVALLGGCRVGQRDCCWRVRRRTESDRRATADGDCDAPRPQRRGSYARILSRPPRITLRLLPGMVRWLLARWHHAGNSIGGPDGHRLVCRRIVELRCSTQRAAAPPLRRRGSRTPARARFRPGRRRPSR